MEFIVIGLVVLILYSLVRLVATSLSQISGARFRAYRQLAARYQGRYEGRGLVDPPTVSFSHNGSSVRVGLAPVAAGQPPVPRTRVVARFGRGLPFRFELLPIRRPAPAQPPKGTRLVRCGDPEFDRNYVIQANDPAMTRDFLSPTVRQSIENLRRLAPPAGMLVSINPERLLVQVDRNLGSMASGTLDLAVREALILHDWLRTSVVSRLSEGIDIVRVGPAAAEGGAGPPVCTVCRDPITERHVVCATCRTPHHHDCWTFIGGCSIFGCQGKQSISVAESPGGGIVA